MIRAVQYSAADLAVDAIVRAADASLAPLGAASAALDDAAGPRFREDGFYRIAFVPLADGKLDSAVELAKAKSCFRNQGRPVL